jgi:tetrahydromethanopterin:alpha-L-glutamate ligase
VKIAVAGIEGAWSSEHLAERLRSRGVDSFVFSLGDTIHDLVSGQVTWRDKDLRDLDAVIVKKLGSQSNAAARLRLHALRSIEGAGARIFSPVETIDRAMDRYRMTMMLAGAGLPVPATLAAESGAALEEAARRMDRAIVKPIYTSKGRGMVMVDSQAGAGLDSLPAADDQQHYLVQRFVESPGRDVGATVIGGNFVGAFYRVAREGEWMTTTAAGGVYAPCELSSKGIEYAERAARAFALDYTVVDLVEQDDDFLIYEVSAFGGFRGLLEASGVDAADAYADYILRSVKD